MEWIYPLKRYDNTRNERCVSDSTWELGELFGSVCCGGGGLSVLRRFSLSPLVCFSPELPTTVDRKKENTKNLVDEKLSGTVLALFPDRGGVRGSGLRWGRFPTLPSIVGMLSCALTGLDVEISLVFVVWTARTKKESKEMV